MKKTLIILGVVLGACLIGLVGCFAIVGKGVEEVDKELNKEHTVTYKVTGTGSASMTYMSSGNLDTSQENGKALPWSKTVTFKGTTLGVNMNAQLQTPGATAIGCEIIVDGKSVAKNKSSGEYAVVTCTAD